MDTNSIPGLNYLPPKYQGYALLIVALSPYICRAIYSLMNRGGIKGVVCAIWLGTNTPKTQPQQQPAQPGNDNMKTIVSLIAILGLSLSLTANAQTNTAPQTTDVPTFLGQVYDTMVGQGLTNLDVAIVETYTPSIKEWGTGAIISRNLPLGGGISTGVGLGVDYYNKNFYAVSGQLSLKADLTPFSNWGSFGKSIILSPFVFTGLGTPFGTGSNGAGGGLETILATGANLHLAHVLGGDLGLIGLYGTREGLGAASGKFYGGGLNMLWKF